MKIEEPISLLGYAWFDDEGDIVWADKSAFEGEERPVDATPVAIEIIPVDQWVEQQSRDQMLLGDVLEKINKFQNVSNISKHLCMK